MKLSVPAGARVASTFLDWTLYELPPRDGDSFLWLKFKLMLPGSAPRRRGQYRVYRLNWNAADGRLAKDARLAHLRGTLPDLAAAVETWLSTHRGPDALLATEAEIAAERARLAAARRQWKGASS